MRACMHVRVHMHHVGAHAHARMNACAHTRRHTRTHTQAGMHVRHDRYELDMAMKVFDGDGDGHIDCVEFEHVLSQYHAVLEMRKLEAALKSHTNQTTAAELRWHRRAAVMATRRISTMWPARQTEKTRDSHHHILSGLVMRTADADVGAAMDRLVGELESRHEQASELLARLDSNGDGALSRDELMAGLTELGTPANSEILDLLPWHSLVTTVGLPNVYEKRRFARICWRLALSD